MNNFKTLDLSIELYKECKTVKLPYYLKDQLLRASSSICLNLAEGNNRRTTADRRKFFIIALGSLREVQVIFKMEGSTCITAKSDQVGAYLYKLLQNIEELN